MKNKFLKLTIFLITLQVSNSFAQSPVRDRWDTLCSNITTSFTPGEDFSIFQVANYPVNNQLLILGDSIHEINNGISSSYLQMFNPANSSLTPITYTRELGDYGVSGSAIVNTNTTNLSYVFFGGKLATSLYTDHFILYKHNTLTSAVTSETLNFAAPDYHKGILNMAFFSPTTNHDTLVIFNHSKWGIDSINIYKKHYNQTGFINSNVKLPEPVTNISKVFVFNNVMYVSGRNGSTNYIFNSTDGLTFTTNASYTTSLGSLEVVDMDTLNNELYLAMNEPGNTYSVFKTTDGVTFTPLVTYSMGIITSLKKYNKRMWFSTKFAYPSKFNPNSSSTNAINEFKPNVYYWDAALNTDVLSIDTIGRPDNDALSFRLQKVGSDLLYTGNFRDYNNYDFGTFVYKFVPPVANFSPGSLNKCLFSAFTFSNQSLNADSVRWVFDNNFYASNLNTYSPLFNTVGNHTVGLIAISGTQKDTMRHTINVYSVTITMGSSLTGCRNNKINIAPGTAGAIAPITYSWSVGSGINASALNTNTINLFTNATGTYTYNLNISDANNCVAYSATNNITINPNTDITGIATSSAVPVAGNIVLYRYEPMLTKFDSVTYVSTDALGAFSFSSALGAATYTNGGQTSYLVKCIPSANSLQVTYAPDALGWKNAAIVSHGCLANTNQNINVVPLTVLAPGPGVLSGKLTEGVGYVNKGGIFAPGNPIKGMIIKGGRNPGGDIVNQVTTDANGGFTLTGLPVNATGTGYFILVDIPGLDTNSTYYRSISASETEFTDLDFVVDSAKINPVNSVNLVKEVAFNEGTLKVYPNPTEGLMNIEMKLSKPEMVEIKIMDVTGKLVKTILNTDHSLMNEISVQTNLNELQNGIYFMRIKIGDTERNTKIILNSSK